MSSSCCWSRGRRRHAVGAENGDIVPSEQGTEMSEEMVQGMEMSEEMVQVGEVSLVRPEGRG